MDPVAPLTLRTLFLIPLTIFTAVILAGCGGGRPSGSSGGSGETTSGGSEATSDRERVTVGGTEALVWGEGSSGVILLHDAVYDAASWSDQAEEIVKSGATVLAVVDTSAGSTQAATYYLRNERGVRSVSLIGESASSAGVLGASRQNLGEVAQIILISGTREVSSLGDYPKLFAASEGEGLAKRVRQMAREAPGSAETLIVGGDAHAQAIFDSPSGGRLLQKIKDRVSQYG